MANLKELTRLNLSHNSLTSGIPSELSNLSDLSVLYLAVNRLEGGIPTELGSLSNLTALWLSENQLTGEIPPSLGDLHNLRLLYLWHNQLSGEIPPEFGNLSELRSLVLHENHLTGEIPAELGNLSFLEVLHLKNNQLIGCIPDSLGDVRDNDLDELGLPLCGEVEDPTPSPVPTPTQACIESLPGSGVFTGFWTDDCVSLHPDRQGSYARFYTLDLPEDSDLVVTLESSVDTYLYLRAGDGRDGEILDSDDDDDNNDFSLNSGTDSGMRLTSLEAGDYTIEATTYSAGEGGQFTLTVQGLSTVATPAPTPTVAPVTPTPQPVTSRKVLSIGSGHICSLDANGIIDCWGSDDHGQTTLPPSIAGTAFSAVSSGANHTCALTNLGSIACWGANDHGQTTLPASLAGHQILCCQQRRKSHVRSGRPRFGRLLGRKRSRAVDTTHWRHLCRNNKRLRFQLRTALGQYARLLGRSSVQSGTSGGCANANTYSDTNYNSSSIAHADSQLRNRQRRLGRILRCNRWPQLDGKLELGVRLQPEPMARSQNRHRGACHRPHT